MSEELCCICKELEHECICESEQIAAGAELMALREENAALQPLAEIGRLAVAEEILWLGYVLHGDESLTPERETELKLAAEAVVVAVNNYIGTQRETEPRP